MDIIKCDIRNRRANRGIKATHETPSHERLLKKKPINMNNQCN